MSGREREKHKMGKNIDNIMWGYRNCKRRGRRDEWESEGETKAELGNR